MKRRFQLHLSTVLICTLMAGAMMGIYFQFSKMLSIYDPIVDSTMPHFAMHSSFIAFCVGILIGTAVVCEKAIAVAPAAVPARVDRD